MSLRSRFMARFYDSVMQDMEESTLSEWRSELLSGLRGDILEIGSGTGVNLAHYPDSIDSLVLTEPNPHMLELLRQKTGEIDRRRVKIESFESTALHFPDDSFDAVVSTLVLCSVESPEATLTEIRRVLKPGGKFLFIEHVLAKDTPHLIKWQKFVQPIWKYLFGNCHLTRDTEANISSAGFVFHTIERLNTTADPAIVSPKIRGIATVIPG